MKRWLFLLFLSITFCRIEAGAENMIQLRLDFDEISVSGKGIYFVDELDQEVPIDNLHVDERGFYTRVSFGYACSQCGGEYLVLPDRCLCLSEDFVVISENEELLNRALKGYLLGFLNELLREELLCRGQLVMQGSADTKGKKSVEIVVENVSEDGNVEWKGSAGGGSDEEGKAYGEAKIELKVKF